MIKNNGLNTGNLALSGFIFLRVISPHLTTMAMQLDGNVRSSLLLVAKVIQSISNEASTAKDSNIKCIEDFVEKNRAAVYRWYDEFTAVSDDDAAHLVPIVSPEEATREVPILARILVENYATFFRLGYPANRQFAVDLARTVIGVQSPTSWSVKTKFVNPVKNHK